MKHLDRSKPAPLLYLLARRHARHDGAARREPDVGADAPPPAAPAPPAVDGVPTMWSLSELVEVEGPLDDSEIEIEPEFELEVEPEIEAASEPEPQSEPEPETTRVDTRERDERLDDLRQIESIAPPPLAHGLPPGAESVGAIGGQVFPSSLPPGPMIVPILGRDSYPPPLSEPPPEPDDVAIDLRAFEPRSYRLARVVGPIIAALAVAAGALVVARGGLDRSDPTPAAPAAASFGDRLGEVARHGAPVALRPPDVASTEVAAAPAIAVRPAAPAPMAGAAQEVRTTKALVPVAAPTRDLAARAPDPVAPTPKPPAPPSLDPNYAPPTATPSGDLEAAMSTAAPAAAAAEGPGFDATAAARAIADAELRAGHCASAFEDRQGAIGGEVAVTFAPSGRATNAVVTGSRFSGRLEGSCVARVFREARVPAFSGEAVTVRRRIQLR